MGRKADSARKKRRLRIRASLLSQDEKDRLLAEARHECTPPHKEHPGDWGLPSPPSGKNPEKTLCEPAGVTDADQAQDLFQQGIARGLVSEQTDSEGRPKRLWLVLPTGQAFEAKSGGSFPGAYHGFPVLRDHPAYLEIREAWTRLICPTT
jgi:hypothetical protein